MPEVYGIKLDGINHTITQDTLKSLFQRFSVHSIVIGKNNSHAYVNLLNQDDADRFVKSKSHGFFVNGVRVIASLVPRKNFKLVTDCKFGRSCSRQESCEYRHNIDSENVCKDWINKFEKCPNVNCPYRHPSTGQNLPSSTTTSSLASGTISQPTDSTPKLSALEQKLSKKCECPICFERMSEPKSLSCRHSFCKDCLNDIVKFEESMVSLKCPICNQDTQLSFGETTSNLECELALKQDIDILDTEKPREVAETATCFNKKCTNKKPTNACGDCGVLFCGNCMEQHFNNCPSNCRNLLDVKYSHEEEGIFSFCRKHDCLSKHYCCTCQKFCCIYCKNWEHVSHQLKTVRDYGNEHQSNFKAFLDEAEKTRMSCNIVERKIDLASKESLASLKKHVTLVKYELMSKVWVTLNQVEEKLGKKLNEACSTYKKENTQIRNKAKKLINDSNKCSSGTNNFIKILNELRLQKNYDSILDSKQNEERKFNVELSDVSSSSIDEDLFAIINKKICKVSVSLDDDTTEIVPAADHVVHTDAFKNLQDLDSYKETLRNFVEENESSTQVTSLVKKKDE